MIIDPRWKILYLIAVSVLAFVLAEVYAYGLLALQVLVWPIAGVPLREARYLRKTINFVLVVLLFYSFFGGQRDLTVLALGGFDLKLSSVGFFEGLRMSLRLVTVLVASIIVRCSTGRKAFVQGLSSLGLPADTATLFDSTMAHIEGREGSGTGKGGKKRQAAGPVLKRIFKGDFSVLADAVGKPLASARGRIADKDLAVIFGLTVVVVSIRFLKVLPGVPLAPGIKNLVIIPCFVMAASLTDRKYAATQIGFVSGTINFLSGFGRFGIFDILQSLAPALAVDFLVRITRNNRSLAAYTLIGLVAGLARSTTVFALALLFRMPIEFYVLLGWTALSQCVFGALSAPVSRYMVRNFNDAPAGDGISRE